jgi:hypothetical protein
MMCIRTVYTNISNMHTDRGNPPTAQELLAAFLETAKQAFIAVA